MAVRIVLGCGHHTPEEGAPMAETEMVPLYFAKFMEQNASEHAGARADIGTLQGQSKDLLGKVQDLDKRVSTNSRWLYGLMAGNLVVGGTGATTGLVGLFGAEG